MTTHHNIQKQTQNTNITHRNNTQQHTTKQKQNK